MPSYVQQHERQAPEDLEQNPAYVYPVRHRRGWIFLDEKSSLVVLSLATALRVLL
jgi:hypothetical protein